MSFRIIVGLCVIATIQQGSALRCAQRRAALRSTALHARGRLTSFAGAGEEEGLGSRKYESVRKSLGIPREALSETSLDDLERRMQRRMKRHVEDAQKRQDKRQAARNRKEGKVAAPLSFDEIEFYDSDDESYTSPQAADDDSWVELSDSEAAQLFEDGKMGVAAARAAGLPLPEKKTKGEAGFFLREPPQAAAAKKKEKKEKGGGAADGAADGAAEGAEGKKAAAAAAKKAAPEVVIEDDDERILSLDRIGIVDITADATPADWERLGLARDSPLVENLRKNLGIVAPSAAQSAAIPQVLGGGDVVIRAHTGSGKTLAFLLPVLERAMASAAADGPPTVLIVCPTRELATQTAAVASRLLEGTGRRSLCCVGGANAKRQRERLRKDKPMVVVGTPGRLAELTSKGAPGMGSGVLSLRRVRHCVLDEGDDLLAAGCANAAATGDLLAVLTEGSAVAVEGVSLPRATQIVVASATARADSAAAAIARAAARTGAQIGAFQPAEVAVGPAGGQGESRGTLIRLGSGTGELPPNIAHAMCVAEERRKVDALRRIFNTKPAPPCVLVFVADPEEVQRVVRSLNGRGIRAAPLSGKDTKEHRADVVRSLREGLVGAVVTTDVAARGLDAPAVTHVVNLNMPSSETEYAHRAGRCGRAGSPGIVISVVEPKMAFVGRKFAKALGVPLHSVEVKHSRALITGVQMPAGGAGEA